MNQKSVDANIKNLFFLSWLVVAIAIIAVAFVIMPTGGPIGFWLRVLWIEILNLLFCKGTEGWFTRYKSNSRTSILPLSDSLTLLYCLISFGLLIYFKQYEEYNSILKSHAITQIVALTLYFLISFRIQLAANYADTGLETADNALESPVFYANKLSLIEGDVNPLLKSDFKKLREKFRYSLLNNNKTRSHEEYKKLVREIEDMSQTPERITASKIKQLRKDLDKLIIILRRK